MYPQISKQSWQPSSSVGLVRVEKNAELCFTSAAEETIYDILTRTCEIQRVTRLCANNSSLHSPLPSYSSKYFWHMSEIWSS